MKGELSRRFYKVEIQRKLIQVVIEHFHCVSLILKLYEKVRMQFIEDDGKVEFIYSQEGRRMC